MTLLSKALNENNRKRWPFGATENDVLNKKVCPHQEKPRKGGRQQLFLLFIFSGSRFVLYCTLSFFMTDLHIYDFKMTVRLLRSFNIIFSFIKEYYQL